MQRHSCIPRPMLFTAAALLMALSPGAPAAEPATNDLTQALIEMQRDLPVPEASAALYLNAPDREARLAQSAAARAAALSARQAVKEEIELLPEGGAIARYGTHTVRFEADALGGIELRGPAGLRLRSRVLGLCYWSASGRSVMLAELQSSVGEVNGSSALYPKAFGSTPADLLFEYTRSSFEQSVILRARLPDPWKDCGFAPDEQVSLAVLTEFFDDPPEPRRTPAAIDLAPHYRALGIDRAETLPDETLLFDGGIRIIEGKSFMLGQPDRAVPSGKSWQLLRDERGNTRRFLLELTPYELLKPLLETLPPRTAGFAPRQPRDAKATLLALQPPAAPGTRSRLLARAELSLQSAPGLVLDYLLVTTPLLNIDFGWGAKSGLAAFGQETWDYWNNYYYTGYEPGWLAGLYWSDWTPSAAGIVVSNAPGTGYSPFCLDPMLQYFVHPQSGGSVTVLITNLPANVYDLVVYAARASAAGAPSFELKRAGTSLWHKAATIYGNNWYSSYWDEGEQFVRFRNIPVTNQVLQLISLADAAGYAAISGLQIIPSSALPSEQPSITQLMNINVGANNTNKVGLAATGLGAQDFWNGFEGVAYALTTAKTNLKWSDQTASTVGMTIWNAPGGWTSTMWDPMLRSFLYSQNGGNITIALTNLPAGICDVYLYGHGTVIGDFSIFELWSDDVHWGIKPTSRVGYGPMSNWWERGEQYVRFEKVTVTAGKPLVVHSKHSNLGYDSVAGIQIAYTGNADTDSDGLPDGWEQRWFGNLAATASEDPDADTLSNLHEYRLGLDPQRADSDADGLADGLDAEFPWLEDAIPQGGYSYTSGGDNWTWVTNWSDGVGWSGGTVTPHSGQKFRVSANTTNTIHHHYFERAVAVVRPGTSDVFYAWVNLDPTKPPSEVMIQFYTVESNGSGSWDHRAYWGANTIAWGVNGTISRTNVGPLPPTNQWVRLQVPATAVGLQNKIVEGMSFVLYSGRAAWDNAGVFNPDLDGDGSLDLDSDGLPDAWELQYFGNLNQGGSGDPDGDGITNLWEYRKGLNPAVYNSLNGLTGVAPVIFTPLK